MLSTNTVESPKTEPITNLDWALKYAQMGLRVFPLQPGTKVPMTAHGVKDATDARADHPRMVDDIRPTRESDSPHAPKRSAIHASSNTIRSPRSRTGRRTRGSPCPRPACIASGGKGAPHYIFTHTEKSLALGNCDGSTAGREWFSFRALRIGTSLHRRASIPTAASPTQCSPTSSQRRSPTGLLSAFV